MSSCGDKGGRIWERRSWGIWERRSYRGRAEIEAGREFPYRSRIKHGCLGVW
jgi:hypothetical protein